MTIPDFLQLEPDDFIRFASSRVGLHHVVREYNNGESPEALWDHFPTLSLSLIHKAIAFYLDNQKELDERFVADENEFGQQMASARRSPTMVDLRTRFDTMQRREAL